MTVLEGVSLDDLFAYSKLQDLLSRIIAQVNDSNATVQKLAGKAAQEEAVTARLAALEGKLGSFDGNLQERLTAIEDGMKLLALGPEERMQALEKQSLEELQVLRSLTERLEAMGARQASLEESSKKKPFEAEFAERIAGVEAGVAALQARPDLEARVGALEAAAAQPGLGAALEARVAALEERLAEGSVSERLTKVSKSVKDHEARLEKLQGQLANAAAALAGDGSGIRTTPATTGGGGEVSAEAHSELEKRLSGLETALSNAVDELLKEAKRQRGESESRSAAQREAANALAEVREALSALQVLAKETQALVVEEVRPELEASVEKEEQDVIHIMSHIKVLQAQMAELLPKGGSLSTTRCLSCHEKRDQTPTKNLLGNDGKVYARRPSTAAGRTEHVAGDGNSPASGSGSQPPGGKGHKEPKEGWLPDTVSKPNRVAFQGGAGAPLRRYRDSLGSCPPGSPIAAAQRAAASPHAAHVGQLLEKGNRQLSSPASLTPASMASTGHGMSISACDGLSSRPVSPEVATGRLIVGPG